ncbi:MAG: methyltransferase domain-containing protein [Actinobacteria bacterium]|nr:methyltransferase domain-containing protein [Actinomycetota bacterium]
MAVRPRQRRGLGQHFLRSSKLAAELVHAAGIRQGDLVLDLGAGTGVLTGALARITPRLIAVEVDGVLAAALRQRFREVQVLEADVLSIALPKEPFKVVANFPFDGGTAMLRRLLDPRVSLESADVIVDWGLATKRAAVWPGTKLSAYWGAWFELSVVRRLPSGAFAPSPAADGGLLRIERRSEPLVEESDYREFDAFLARGYRDGLRSVVTPHLLKRCAGELGFDRKARPRDLDARQWARLWHAVRRSV